MLPLLLALCAQEPAVDFDPEVILWRELRNSRVLESPTDAEIAETLAGIGEALIDPSVRVARNQEIIALADAVRDTDEIAFLPPMSGG